MYDKSEHGKAIALNNSFLITSIITITVRIRLSLLAWRPIALLSDSLVAYRFHPTAIIRLSFLPPTAPGQNHFFQSLAITMAHSKSRWTTLSSSMNLLRALYSPLASMPEGASSSANFLAYVSLLGP